MGAAKSIMPKTKKELRLAWENRQQEHYYWYDDVIGAPSLGTVNEYIYPTTVSIIEMRRGIC